MKKEMKGVENYLLYKSAYKLLSAADSLIAQNQAAVARMADTPYSYSGEVIKKLRELGLVDLRWGNGRSMLIFVTPKGKKVLHHLRNIKRLLHDN